MKLRNEFITYDTDGESLLVPAGGAGFSGLVKGNKILGAILALLREETTKEAVIAALAERYEAPEEVIARDVETAIGTLREIGALDE